MAKGLNKYYALSTAGNEADVYIFGEITSFPWVEGDVSSYGLARELAGIAASTIRVHINSVGGEVAEGLAIYNTLKASNAKIVTVCDGFACSAAAVVFMAGAERVMNGASLLMIHNASMGARGTADELRKAADELETISNIANSVFIAGGVKLSEEELKRMLDAETWLNPTEAVEMGFATAITDTSDGVKAALMRAFGGDSPRQQQQPPLPQQQPQATQPPQAQPPSSPQPTQPQSPPQPSPPSPTAERENTPENKLKKMFNKK